jgi:arsenate reductase
MAEIGIDISGQRSKNVAEFAGEQWDIVVTVCDEAAENCPFIPGARRTVHMPIPDPAEFTDLPDAEAIPHFLSAREELREKLNKLLNN